MLNSFDEFIRDFSQDPKKWVNLDSTGEKRSSLKETDTLRVYRRAGPRGYLIITYDSSEVLLKGLINVRHVPGVELPFERRREMMCDRIVHAVYRKYGKDYGVNPEEFLKGVDVILADSFFKMR